MRQNLKTSTKNEQNLQKQVSKFNKIQQNVTQPISLSWRAAPAEEETMREAEWQRDAAEWEEGWAEG